VSERLHRRSVPVALAVASFALAFAQRPGVVVADTKINLYVSSSRFLSEVISAWNPSGSLGAVFSGQYSGYLFPMAPFYALGHALGLPTWIVQRLWLGALLAVGAWGVVRLIDAFHSHERGIAHVVAGAMFVVNPYVVTYVDRTSIALLSYALLPWMLVAVHEGLREPRRWRWPALFALFVTAGGGGVNATVLAFVLLGPALLIVHERLLGGVQRGAVAPFLARLAPLTVLASLWWVAGVEVAAVHGPDFLQFTEQPGSIWNTTSLTESLRLMGLWTSYFGQSFSGPERSYVSDAAVMLYQPLVVGASLLVPGLALAGLVWTLRRRYAPFLLATVLLGLLLMTAGFPNGTLLRHGLDFTYYHLSSVQFLRTTYKAGPLVALGLACLGGIGAAALFERLALIRRPRFRAGAPAAALVAIAGLLALGSWPLIRGQALDAQLALPHGVPEAWQSAARNLDRRLPAGDRAMVLPGQLFAYYDWGDTVDPILPALTSRPVAVRSITPFANFRSVSLQWGVDALITQQRGYPGQLRPLLDLLGVGQVISGSDDDLAQSGALSATDAARALAAQGLATPTRAYGPVRDLQPTPGTLDPAQRLPEVRSYDVPTGGIVRVVPRAEPTILDGDGGGVIDMAAIGELDPSRALLYAADLSPAQLRSYARSGANFVISDSNRRQVLVTSSLFQNTGPVFGPSDPISVDSAVLNPFPALGTGAQTVQQLGGGVRFVRAPYSPGFPQFPEHEPFAAIDGNLSTEWLADRHLDTSRRYLQVGFAAPRNVPYVDLMPYDNPRATVPAVTVNGHYLPVHPGFNRLLLHLRHVSMLQVNLDGVTHPRVAVGGGGGIVELRIPGVHPTETLRPPVLEENALSGVDLRRDSLTYLFQRTTGDDPFERQPIEQDPEIGDVHEPGDAETVLARSFQLPASRAWSAQAWVSASPTFSDAAFDRIVGYRGPDSFESSGRFEGEPQYRASSAFLRGGVGPGWIGEWVAGHPAWITVHSRDELAASRLRLEPSNEIVRRPTLVRLQFDGGVTPPLTVAADGTVVLPRTLHSHGFRLDILAAAFPRAASALDRQRLAVGIGRIVGIEHLGPLAIPRRGPLPGGCNGPVLRVAGTTIRLAVRGAIQRLDSGGPLPAGACGSAAQLPAGPVVLRGQQGPLLVDLLALRSPAPDPPAARIAATGRALSPGRGGNGSRTGARVVASGRSWLVLGESFDSGWRAACDGRSLGVPVPIQGYANGWPLDRSCKKLDFIYGPDSTLALADLISGAVAAVLLLTLIVLAVRRRGAWWETEPTRPLDLALEGHPRRWQPRRALAVGVAAAAVLGFVFALRAGVVLGPLLATALWRGLRAELAMRLAGLLLVIVVPAIYLLFPPANLGGFNPNYANSEIYAHFAAVLAVCALGFALARVVVSARAAERKLNEPPSK
jgi:hypothetical protein